MRIRAFILVTEAERKNKERIRQKGIVGQKPLVDREKEILNPFNARSTIWCMRNLSYFSIFF